MDENGNAALGIINTMPEKLWVNLASKVEIGDILHVRRRLIMEKFRDFRRFGAFKLSFSAEVLGELSFNAGMTSLDIH